MQKNNKTLINMLEIKLISTHFEMDKLFTDLKSEIEVRYEIADKKINTLNHSIKKNYESDENFYIDIEKELIRLDYLIAIYTKYYNDFKTIESKLELELKK